MVRTNTKKRKRDGGTVAQDFKRLKRKVGRRAPRKANQVDTSFKTRAVQVRQQAAVLAEGPQSIADVLPRFKHHSEKVRRDAVQQITTLISAPGALRTSKVSPHLPALVAAAAELICDEDRFVRTSLRHLFSQMLQNEGSDAPHWCMPFAELLIFHICAGMSSLSLGCRMDAMRLVTIFQATFPNEIAEQKDQLVSLFAALLQTCLTQVGGSVNQSVSASGQRGVLQMYKKSKAPSAQGKKKTEEQKKWQIVAAQFVNLLKALQTNESDVNWRVTHVRDIDPRSNPWRHSINHPAATVSQDRATDEFQKVAASLWAHLLTVYEVTESSAGNQWKEFRSYGAQDLLHGVMLLEFARSKKVKGLLECFPAKIYGPQLGDISADDINLVLARVLCHTDEESAMDVARGFIVKRIANCRPSQLLEKSTTFLKLLDMTEGNNEARMKLFERVLSHDSLGEGGEETLAFLRALRGFVSDRELKALHWVLHLPKLLWVLLQNEEMRCADVLLDILAQAAVKGIRFDEWERVAKQLVPILFIQKKGSNKIDRGPFLDFMDSAMRLKFLDVIIYMPVGRSYPTRLLRGLLLALREEIDEDCGVRSRILDVPFISLSISADIDDDCVASRLAELCSFVLGATCPDNGINDLVKHLDTLVQLETKIRSFVSESCFGEIFQKLLGFALSQKVLETQQSFSAAASLGILVLSNVFGGEELEQDVLAEIALNVFISERSLSREVTSRILKAIPASSKSMCVCISIQKGENLDHLLANWAIALEYERNFFDSWSSESLVGYKPLQTLLQRSAPDHVKKRIAGLV